MTTSSFTQKYIQTQQRRMIINSIILTVIIILVLLGYYLLNPLSSFDISVQWFFPIVIVFTLIYSIYLYYKRMQLYLSMEIELDTDKISASYFEKPQKVIQREEVKQIVNLKGSGLRIDCINSELSIFLPKELQNYDQLKVGLSSWSPFINQSDPILRLYAFLSFLIIVGIVMIIYPPTFLTPVILNIILFFAMLSIVVRFLKRKKQARQLTSGSS